ncbi:CHAT domain-containing protein [Aquimarina muelleri]|uniref:CHAT domain-containing protein n=1 Tax=Aquimarina muelleri TaxID=279356 RepID=A0A918JSF5_9FLAO|nr:CHAT domain-containing tetratricopeptide repeat protein [Aquimarina muelleri]MCX2761603.1 CHAT domain-containing protein [Aquimarina muelleri]GGX07627.1 hypothetical protein GCM10007384_06620 [Aquimarina muelleri]
MKPIFSFFNTFCLVVVFFITSLHTINAQTAKDTLLAYQYYQKADSLFADRKLNDAITYYQKALPIYKKAKAWERVASCYNQISENQWRSRKLEESLTNAKKALEISTTYLAKNNIEAAIANSNMGSTYYEKSDLKTSLIYHQKSLAIKQKMFPVDDKGIAVTYSNLGILYNAISEYEKAISFHQKSLDINIKLFGEEHTRVGIDYYNLANTSSNLEKHSQALNFYQKNLDITIKNKGSNHILVGYSYVGLASYFNDLKQYDNSLSYYQKALSIFQKHESLYPLFVSYINIGLVLTNKGEYSNALLYHQKGLNIGLKIVNKNHPSLGLSYWNIGFIYDKKEEKDIALDYYQKALEISKYNYGENHVDIGDLYINIGSSYMDKKDYEKSLAYYTNALNIYKKVFKDENSEHSKSYLSLSILYLKQDNYEEALVNAKKSLKILEYLYGEQNLIAVESLNQIGTVYTKLENFQEAIVYFDKAILANTKKEERINPKSVFDPNRYYNVNQLLETLQGKAKTFQSRYLKTKNISDLDQSLSIYEQADTIINHIRQSFQDYQDKISFGNIAKEVYQGAIEAQILLYKHKENQKALEQAFYYAEKSKANTLIDLLNDSNAKNYTGLPADLVELEKSLRVDRAFYQSNISKEQSNTNQDTSKIQEYENKLFDINRKQDSVTKILEKNYPKYYQLKYQNNIVSVKQIQKQLEDNTTLLEFFTADSTTYAFTISKNDMAVHELVTPQLTDKVEALRASVISKDVATYKKQAHLLYTTLIAPVANTLVGDNLIIIPDASLWHLNFDLLLTKKDDSNNPALLSYMLREYAITYANSANLLFQDFKNDLQTKTNPECLAFSFSDSTQITQAQTMRLAALRNTGADLPGTRKEIKAISNIIDGEYYFGSNAIEANFKKNADRYAIIHLALHGEVDNEHPENSKLFFTKTKDTLEDNNLYSHELFALDIPAELAVLSACNTGTGKIAKGEGIMSLGTAFQYAGTKSLLLTSWEVSDKTTPEIMQYFYTNLKAGMNKGKALQQAKLQYLTTANINRTYPFYWGGFYLVGNPDPMHFADNTLVYWILGLGILSILVFVGWQYRQRLKNR